MGHVAVSQTIRDHWRVLETFNQPFVVELEAGAVTAQLENPCPNQADADQIAPEFQGDEAHRTSRVRFGLRGGDGITMVGKVAVRHWAATGRLEPSGYQSPPDFDPETDPSRFSPAGTTQTVSPEP